MNLRLKAFKWLINWNFSVVKFPNVWTTGTMNRVPNGFVFYIDYDMMEIDWVTEELKLLQEVYDLGNIHLFQSSKKGFHAVSFSKLKSVEYIEILKNSSCDEAFKNVPRFVSLRNFVLRNFEKGKTPAPVYLKTLLAETKRQKSHAHYKFFKLLYPEIEKNEDLINFDDSQVLQIIQYPTGGNVNG